MARMYPNYERELNSCYAESKAYNALKKLPQEYMIFHSISWIEKKEYNPFHWYENDFLILHPTYGILVLEIKGGEIRFQDGIVYQKNTITKKEVALDHGNDPYNQAKNGMFFFLNLIEEKLGKEMKKKVFISPAVWFPSTVINRKVTMSPEYDTVKDIIMDSLSFDNLEQSLKAIYDFYKQSPNWLPTQLSNSEMEQIKKVIAPNFDLVPSPSIIKEELDSEFIHLTREQQYLINYISEQRFAVIKGGAGTGKTLVALEAARYLSYELHRKVLFICFNSFLCEHLQKDCFMDNVTFKTIISFVGDYTAKDVTSPLIREEEIKGIDNDLFEYDDVIIDEAQDLSYVEISFFNELLKKRDGSHFYVFYDKNQMILNNPKNKADEEKTKKLLNLLSGADCKLLLSANCRNTFSIAKTSNSIINQAIKQKEGVPVGTTPLIIFNKSKEESIEALYNLIMDFKTKDEFKNQEITILSLTTEEKSILAGIDDLNGLKISRKRDGINIMFTTAKKFKGLENKVVIIVDVDSASLSEEEESRVFYVACSRAMHKLALFVTATDEEIKAISQKIAGNNNGKGAIVQKTQTKIAHY